MYLLHSIICFLLFAFPFCCSFCSYSLCSNTRIRFALLQMPLSSTFACNPVIRFHRFLHRLTVPSLASCIYPSTMAVQFCFWQWNNHGLKRIGASIDLSPNPGTTHSHSIVAWLFNSASGNGTVIALCAWGTFKCLWASDSAANPRPYATHSRAVLTWIFNSACGKVVGQQIRLGW